jgi:Fe2+/Zn2+ uptake regulation proteins
MCEILFDRKKTFHFTIDDLRKILKKKLDIKISQATIYNTINAFKNKGYIKEISLNSDKTYFDTNITNHHHFYNETTNELIDFHDKDVEEIKLRKNLPGKKIKSIEVLVKVSNK